MSEGVLSAPVLAAGWALAAGGVAQGLRKMPYDRIPRVAVVTSAFFVASLIRVPFGPASLHLSLNGLLGLLLGWMAFPSALSALLLQAVLFQYGGLTTLGINTLVAASPAVAVHYAFGPLMRKCGGPTAQARGGLPLAGFAAGAGAAALGTALLALALYETEARFANLIKLVALANVPAVIAEGLITASVITFLWKVKPEILPRTIRPGRPPDAVPDERLTHPVAPVKETANPKER
jgi:cobalt/nickel transport system permease protein